MTKRSGSGPGRLIKGGGLPIETTLITVFAGLMRDITFIYDIGLPQRVSDAYVNSVANLSWTFLTSAY